jgi:Uma2 family endonuclease
MLQGCQARTTPAPQEQRVCLQDVASEDYETLLAIRGERAGLRITFLEGELELLSPSVTHEDWKIRLGRLLEAWAEEGGVELEGFGSWTVKSRAVARGVEPDGCYLIGPLMGEPQVPDIAIEVLWTSGGIDKLKVYRGLRVPEVWFWKDGALRFFALEGDGYLACPRSRLLPGLDPALIARCMGEASQTQAMRVPRSALRSPPETDERP